MALFGTLANRSKETEGQGVAGSDALSATLNRRQGRVARIASDAGWRSGGVDGADDPDAAVNSESCVAGAVVRRQLPAPTVGVGSVDPSGLLRRCRVPRSSRRVRPPAWPAVR